MILKVIYHELCVTEETARLDGPTLEEVEFSFSSAG